MESIPIKLNLFKRKAVDSSHCLICWTKPEIVLHALWNCKTTQDVWGSSLRRLQKCSVGVGSFHDLLSQFFNPMPNEISVEMAVITHKIWKRRNLMVFEDSFISLEKLVLQSYKIMEEYSNAVTKSQA